MGQRIVLTESQLRQYIAEAVDEAMNDFEKKRLKRMLRDGIIGTAAAAGLAYGGQKTLPPEVGTPGFTQYVEQIAQQHNFDKPQGLY